MNTTSIIRIILCSTLMSVPYVVSAETDSLAKTSKSISYKNHQTPSDFDKNILFDQAEKDITSLSLQKSLMNTASTQAARHSESSDYSLYDASTDLIIDDDDDGFYHRFSVNIDADTIFDHSTVYADFYLSYEGGPWIYYASSDSYDIHYDAIDAFTIETELADGYPTGYYDMRIKLYDAYTDEYLLTYDYLDDDSLNAIPLEDRYRDSPVYYSSVIETEVIISHGAGSLNFAVLFILCLLLAAQRIRTIFILKDH